MVYEVSDANDGRRLFYGTGPIHVAVGQNVILRLAGAGTLYTHNPHDGRITCHGKGVSLHTQSKTTFTYTHSLSSCLV